MQRPVVKKLWVAGRASEERRVDERCEGPLRKMLRRQRRDFGGARGEGTRSTMQRRQSDCLARTKSPNSPLKESFEHEGK